MKLYQSNQIAPSLRKELCRRPSDGSSTATVNVREICLDVKRRGDIALREYSRQFDAVAVNDFRVKPEEFAAARTNISDTVRQAFQAVVRTIRMFHAAQLGTERRIETMPGVVCWRERRAIERVGLYVPAGSAPLPSTVFMLGIPAMLAGCSRIILCSPPQANGSVDPFVLAAAEMIGIAEVYKVGGAQAIAAMAYGTESIPKADKIFGPGNKYVTAAKQFVSFDPDGASIDLLAGPSELLIIADEFAQASFVASDLLSQAEHDPFSQVVLVTPSRQLAFNAEKELKKLVAALPRAAIARQALEGSFMLIVDSLEEAVSFSNDYAPEHLIINTRSPETLVPQIHNAGSVFLGAFAPVTAGDYASGTNHTLPTSGTAKWFSGVSVESFQKTVTFQTITREGLRNLAPTLTTLAGAEGLEAHKQAVEVRLNTNDTNKRI